MIKKLSIVTACFICLFSYAPHLSSADSGSVRITEIEGLVQLKSLGTEDWVKVEEGAKLFSGDQLRSFLSSSAKLIFLDKSEFILGENSSLDIKDISKNPRTGSSKRALKLNLGSLHYKVIPKAQTAAEFKIHSSTSIVGITGTEGIVVSEGNGKLTENILIEGSTYNTNAEGNDGVYQRHGNVYKNEEGVSLFMADVKKEVKRRVSVEDASLSSLENLIKQVEIKKKEGFDLRKTDSFVALAYVHLENRAYKVLDEVIARIEQSIKEAKRYKISSDVSVQINGLFKKISEKEMAGFDVSAIYLMMGSLDDSVLRGDLSIFDELVLTIEQKLASLEEDSQESTYFDRYREVQEMLLIKEEEGFKADEIKAGLRASRTYYQNNNKTKAYKLLDDLQKDIQLLVKGLTDSLKQRITRLDVAIKEKASQGYHVGMLEVALDEVQKSVEAESYLKVQSLLNDIETQLSMLNKSLPLEWLAKIEDLKKEIISKQALGYNLTGIDDAVQSLQESLKQRDIRNIKTQYDVVSGVLKALGLPAGFEADWQKFKNDYDEKVEFGLNLKEVKDLKVRVESAIGSGDVNIARSFLQKAKEALKNLKDEEPPLLQILSFEEEGDQIKLEGFVTDNARVKYVFVNNDLVDIGEDGVFTYMTKPSASLKKITVVAEDITGNKSPKIEVPVTIEGIAINSGEITDVKLEYDMDEILVSGHFLPGGKVMVGENTVYGDIKGGFSSRVNIKTSQTDIHIRGSYDNGTQTEGTVLNLEDKWAPSILITDVEITHNIVPKLEMDPLKYSGDRLHIAGQIDTKVMATVEGVVTDRGSSMRSVMIDQREIDLDEDGKFSTSFALDSDMVLTKVIAEDIAGNIGEEQIIFDGIVKRIDVFVNDERILFNSKGDFSETIILTKDLHEVNVVLKDKDGVSILSQKMLVANVLPPRLEITDITYKEEKAILSGYSDSDATVGIKDSVEQVIADKQGAFNLDVDVSSTVKNVELYAKSIEGKISDTVKLELTLPQDTQAPSLYVSSPEFKGDVMIVSGFVEESSGHVTVMVQSERIEVNEIGHFKTEVLTDNVDVVIIEAKDSMGNVARQKIAVADKEAPVIEIDRWEVADGNLVIEGRARDNIGVKEIRLNNMPIVRGDEKALTFSYSGVLTGKAQQAVIVAVDLADNEARDGPRALNITSDGVPPSSSPIALQYGSPIVYISGQVKDGDGIAAVYVNGVETEIFDDGGFNVKVEIDVADPTIALTGLSYNDGQVTVEGNITKGVFSPAEIIVEAEDLSGSRAVLSTQTVDPYQLEEINVFVDGVVVDMDDQGSFTHEQNLVIGNKTFNILATDPFDNSSDMDADLERRVPELVVEPLEYDEQQEVVLIRGKASDSDSGLNKVFINGVSIDFNDDGSFAHSASFADNTLSVTAQDYVGNEVIITKEVTPPDVWAPVFGLTIKPTPAIVGKPVFVEIAAIDSNTGLPELLNGLPRVAALIDGNLTPLPVEGEGSNFIAKLETKGLSKSTIPISVEGRDKAGNVSEQLEGNNIIVLIDEDVIAPSFAIEAHPIPAILGEVTDVKVYVSEQLDELPILQVTLPSGVTQDLTLSKVNDQEFAATLIAPLEGGVGESVLRLTGGTDLTGNTHDTSEMGFEFVGPASDTEIPLTIDLIDFVADRFMLKGRTASDAVVNLRVGPHETDIMADTEGYFVFEKRVPFDELEEMHAVSDVIRARIRAHNYAGFESRERVIELVLPELPELGGEYFNIMVEPMPVEQGQFVTFNVEVLQSSSDDSIGFIYMPDGQRFVVDLNGTDMLVGRYEIPQDALLGPAFFEVVAGDVREGVHFDIGLSSEWQQLLDKDNFFNVRVMPDPLILGKDAEIIVDTLGDLDAPPRMDLMLSDGRRETIALQGSGRNFRATFAVPVDLPSGGGEIILNPSLESEIRRPVGFEEEFSYGAGEGVYLFANPNPLIGGEPLEVQVSFPDEVSFVPELFLKLGNGHSIKIELRGNTPGNIFEGGSTLSNDVFVGLAQFIVKDDNGHLLDMFPTHVVPSFDNDAGVNVFMMPDIMTSFDHVGIQLNSSNQIYGQLKAHITFTDGTKMVVPLYGDGYAFNGSFNVPEYAPFGMVSVNIFDEEGNSVATSRGELVDDTHQGGMLDIFLDNPDFVSGDLVRIDVEANWPLNFVPKAVLQWEGGSLDIRLNGNVPGNRFHGEFNAPDEEGMDARIEVFDDKGYVMGDFPLDHHSEDDGDVIITPMPPILGQPLSIQIITPQEIDTPPSIRLIFEDASDRRLNTYGSIPGDTFTGSLDQLMQPLEMVEIIHNGEVVANIPIDAFDTRTELEFDIEFSEDLMPGVAVDVVVRANQDVPFVPRLSMDFAGSTVDVPLNGVPFSKEFLGRVSVPAGAQVDSYNASIFDSQGQMIWQRNYSDEIFVGGVLNLNVVPIDGTGFDLHWDFINGVDRYVILWGITDGLENTVEVEGVTSHQLWSIPSGVLYYFQVVGYAGEIEIARSNLMNAEIPDESEVHIDAPLIVSPSAPVIGSSVDITINPDGPPLNNHPWLRIIYFNGNVEEVEMEGSLPGNSFSYQIASLNDDIDMIEVFMIHSGTIFYTWNSDGEVGGPVNGWINITPDPPMMSQTFDVMVQFDNPVPFVPRLLVEFENGNTKRYDFPQAPNLSVYSYTVPAGDVEDEVDNVTIEDDQNRFLMDRFFDGGPNSIPQVNVVINPNIPTPNQPLDIDLTFDMPVSFIPVGVIEFENGTIISNPFPQAAGLTEYSMTVPAATMEDYVFRMEVQDDVGYVLASFNPSGGGGDISIDSFDVTPDPPTAGTDIDVTVYFNQALPFQPSIRVTFDDSSSIDYVFPNASGNDTYQITIPSADLTGPLDKVSILDDYGTILQDGEYYFSAPASLEYPTGLFHENTGVTGEIKVRWNSVTGVDGYRVYYGLSSRNYTESGSPLEISDPNATQAIINGLFTGNEYFITVESFFGTEESFNPTEISAFPGTGVANVDHFSFDADTTTSEIGDPIFVKLSALDGFDAIQTGFSGNVTISIEEDTVGVMPESWLVSTQDRTEASSDLAQVELFQGEGFFTIDSLEPETLTIDTPNDANDGDLTVDFTSAASTSVIINSFAIDGPSQAVVGSGNNDGALLWVSAVDVNGNVVTTHTGAASFTITDPGGATSVNLALVEGSGSLSGSGTGPYTYTFSAADSGQIILRYTNTEVESTQIIETITGSNAKAVLFLGASKYTFSVNGGVNQTHVDAVSGSANQSVDITVRAALSNNEFVPGYNNTATVTLTGGDPNDTNSVSISDLTPTFSNGEAQFTVSNTEYETIIVNVADGSFNDDFTINFKSTDTNPPQVTEVVAETPWMLRVYFSEEIDETAASDEGQYTVNGGSGGISIDKICWYGDNITVNLAAPMDLGATNASLLINAAAISDGIQIAGGPSNTTNIRVPQVDTQGKRLGGSDWFEVQPSDSSPSVGDTVTVKVFHKNACGYLKGGNSVNASTPGAGNNSASVNYGGGSVAGPTNVGMSGGEGTFSFTANAQGSFTISVTNGGVTGNVDITVSP